MGAYAGGRLHCESDFLGGSLFERGYAEVGAHSKLYDTLCKYQQILNNNVCQKYLERPYSFENCLPWSSFRGINEKAILCTPQTMLNQ